ncbi:Membrane protein PxcA, involved in light-induced proton extrusion [Crocosphaera watsonii WH 0401]|uniref:Membrane protein PxcA, involved in light-induced proton extrusion n=1 Tax=Crocosphaera watsonii WH 0401 TaxID=555881 RepID=T2J732_CROWT|nr:Membrane protein PxcA, involved in light-induced proton extrusion [Crocosphaera watsonii WH 0401]
MIKKTSNWLTATPQRSLDTAYKAALKIKAIEDNHFGGQKVGTENADYGDSVIAYFETEVNGHLQKINMALGVFKTSRLFLNISNVKDPSQDITNDKELQNNATKVAIIFDKLDFIDQVTSHYQSRATHTIDNASLILPEQSLNGQERQQLENEQKLHNSTVQSHDNPLASASQKTGVLPRSFINTLNRIKQEIDPKSGESEEQVINKYRKSRLRTALSIKFILLLIIVPLLTHQLTKTFSINSYYSSIFSKS